MWRRTSKKDDGDLISFLSTREESCMGFISRIWDGAEIRRPNVFSGGIFANRNRFGVMTDALLLSPSGFLHPAFGSSPRTPADEKGLIGKIASRIERPSSVVGLERDVLELIDLMRVEPEVMNGYRVMVHRESAKPGLPFSGLAARQASPDDLNALLPLQCAYEREEVLTRIHRFSEESVRKSLHSALARETVYVCELGGVPVAKAQTNARGFTYTQLGGIYVLPEFRGKGIGTWLVSLLVERLKRTEGRNVSLFVKSGNSAAIRAYEKAGFSLEDHFTIGYFS